jgi:oxygen-independent coproporphyrinogen III oxidase
MKIPGLYIHIPFCLRKCHYCDFYSVTSTLLIPQFLEALFTEMKMYRGRFDAFDTVYIGGGTPSVLTAEQIRDIVAAARSNFNLLPDREITVETNPGDLRLPYLESLRDAGTNRLNIGVQSFDQKVLDFLGRRHSVGQAVAAIEDARKAGFKNVGLDFIYGVPGQAIGLWVHTLERAISFNPEHLSCYQLTLEPGTPLGRKQQEGEFPLPDEQLQHEFFMKTSETLEGAGYVHYEVSNFAKGMTFASRHNQKYWNHTPYLGLGPAAHSFQGNQRWWNQRSVEAYASAIGSGNFPIEGKEMLSTEQLQLEALYLGLRTKKGIHLEEYTRHYRYDLLKKKERLLTKLQEDGLICVKNGRLSPTRSGLAMADSLVGI